jgi:hypothetical protein
MHAFTPALAQRAAREGAAMADARASYAVAPWVIYQSKNPLRATHGRAGVDAIVIETPYERVRYYGYLHRLQGDAITGSLVHRLYDGARGVWDSSCMRTANRMPIEGFSRTSPSRG